MNFTQSQITTILEEIVTKEDGLNTVFLTQFRSSHYREQCH